VNEEKEKRNDKGVRESIKRNVKARVAFSPFAEWLSVVRAVGYRSAIGNSAVCSLRKRGIKRHIIYTADTAHSIHSSTNEGGTERLVKAIRGNKGKEKQQGMEREKEHWSKVAEQDMEQRGSTRHGDTKNERDLSATPPITNNIWL